MVSKQKVQSDGLVASAGSAQTIKVAVVGGSGYTGLQLILLLLNHPNVSLEIVTSRSNQGKYLYDLHPVLMGLSNIRFSDFDEQALGGMDVVFFATPHAVAMNQLPSLMKFNCKVIDLSADFRISDPKLFEAWYGEPHAAPELLDQAVYGLPEYFAEKIANARIVANPGCYPTCTLLSILPLLNLPGFEQIQFFVDAKSGNSGAGRNAKTHLLAAELMNNYVGYSLSQHRHYAEMVHISQQLLQSELLNRTIDESVSSVFKQNTVKHTSARFNNLDQLVFAPHLMPVSRGMMATVFVSGFDPEYFGQCIKDERHDDLVAGLTCYLSNVYRQSPFVKIYPNPVAIKPVLNTNQCHIHVTYQKHTRALMIHSVIDNLIKGASGQAIHNMNLMMNLNETAGLQLSPPVP